LITSLVQNLFLLLELAVLAILVYHVVQDQYLMNADKMLANLEANTKP